MRITVFTATMCTTAAGTAGDVRLGCTGTDKSELKGSYLLLATGRTPNSDNLGLAVGGHAIGDGGGDAGVVLTAQQPGRRAGRR